MIEPFLDLSLPVLLEPTFRRRPKDKKKKRHTFYSPIVESDEKGKDPQQCDQHLL
jgi:hypothetical protein